MRWYKGPIGDQRIWFEDVEIERAMDDELRKSGLFPTAEAPIVDVERFIERHLQAALDHHAPLPQSILGLTEFALGRPPTIRINRDLSDAALEVDDATGAGVLGRWRATLAHEAAHVVLHRVLFELDDTQLDLFGGNSSQSLESGVRCLKRDVDFGRKGGDWREVQANKGMAALLMPRSIFSEIVRRVAQESSIVLPTESGSVASMTLASVLAKRLQVSRQAAAIRLNTLNFATASGQIGGLA